MLRTYEAVLKAIPAKDKVARRVLVTFTKETEQFDTALCGASLSEMALAEDWSRHEEDAAWAHLQATKSS